ncbi:hypothetical protein Micbo1qcDRAFT_108701, partial [Microdochium bolleyi]
LQKLPREINLQILSLLDIPTLSGLRRASLAARNAIDSLLEYKAIAHHAPSIITGILSINANNFSLLELYHILTKGAQCASCRRQGFYLYLITCKRICRHCFTSKLDYRPIQESDAMRETGLSEEDLELFPHVDSVPGCYGQDQYVSRHRLRLFDRQALSQRHMLHEPVPQERTLIQEVVADACRYMAIVSAPLLGVSCRVITSCDWGVYCLRCRGSEQNRGSCYDKYTQQGFTEHMEKEGSQHG